MKANFFLGDPRTVSVSESREWSSETHQRKVDVFLAVETIRPATLRVFSVRQLEFPARDFCRYRLDTVSRTPPQARLGAAHDRLIGLPWPFWRDGQCGQPIIFARGPETPARTRGRCASLAQARYSDHRSIPEEHGAGALISFGFHPMGLFYDIAILSCGGARSADADRAIAALYMAVNLKTAPSLGVCRRVCSSPA
jgi:hypothetical protein